MSDYWNHFLGGFLLMSLGLLCLMSAWRDSNWFFNNYKAAFWVRLLGRKGARWFYAGLGSFLFLVGLVTWFLRS
ncbi:MAG: immunity 17 family protein [Verrucomicrobiaceae bacterium]|nr:immunity 17 family protein [Verrucomicrobiaceae bacterium]